MLQRFARQHRGLTKSQRQNLQLNLGGVAQFARKWRRNHEMDYNSEEDDFDDEEESYFDDSFITKENEWSDSQTSSFVEENPILNKKRKARLLQRPQYPAQAQENRYMAIAPEKKALARRRILDTFREKDLPLYEPEKDHYLTPDVGILEDHEEFDSPDNELHLNEKDEDAETDLGSKGLIRKIVFCDRVQKVIPLGKILRFRALVVVGNENGAAGYAIGKAPSIPEAVERATTQAMRNFTFVDRFDNRTLHHEVTGQFNSCKLFIRPAPQGRGVKVSDTVACVLDCFGIEDVVSKTHGQRNPFTVVKATFDALKQHRTAEEYAWATGTSLVEVSKLAKSRQF